MSNEYIGYGGTTKSFIANKEGGIFFQNLSPVSLWRDKLGFDNSICITPDDTRREVVQYTELANGTHPYNNTNVPVYSGFKESKNITGNLKNLDGAVLKSGAAGFTYGVVQENAAMNGQAITSNVMTEIYSSFPQANLREGYFLVAIDTTMKQDFRGATQNGNNPALTNSNRVQAIVNRYYSTASFTAMEGGIGSVVYTHKGNPVNVSSFKVSILDPTGLPAENIGANNTVFLEIKKITP